MLYSQLVCACVCACVYVCVCIQCDLGDVDETELCDELKCCQHFRTSAKRGEGISQAIECLVDDVRI